jgi:hypothetical protein
MNRIATMSAIAAFSVLSFSGISYAESTNMNWPAEIDHTVRDFKGTKFDVIDVDTLNKMSETHTWIDQATPEQVKSLQSSIEANKPFAEKLKAQKVELNNVIGAEQAADGSLTIYTR